MEAWTAWTTACGAAMCCNGTRLLQAQLTQVLPTGPRAVRRRQPRGVLLDHQPAVVADLAQRGQQRRHIQQTATELGEHAPSDAFLEPPLMLAQLTQDIAIDISHVQVGDPLGMLANDLDRAGPRVEGMADVPAHLSRGAGTRSSSASSSERVSTNVPTCGWKVACKPCSRAISAAPRTQSAMPSHCCAESRGASAARPANARRSGGPWRARLTYEAPS